EDGIRDLTVTGVQTCALPIWRVFGRTDRFYMKEFEAETNLRCYLVLDCSGSMGFSGQHGSKLEYAKRIAATLGYLVIHQGDAAEIGRASCRERVWGELSCGCL